jgi:hypothetical protein
MRRTLGQLLKAKRQFVDAAICPELRQKLAQKHIDLSSLGKIRWQVDHLARELEDEIEEEFKRKFEEEPVPPKEQFMF